MAYLLSFFAISVWLPLYLQQLVKICDAYYAPEQIHINMGNTPDQMIFNWLTWDSPDIVTSSIVRLGTTSSHPNDLTMNISGSASVFTDCGEEKINRTIHVVNVSSLSASTLYYYQVGDIHYGFSDIYSFTTPPNALTVKSTLPHNFILFGDMGTTNTQACGPATEYVLNGDINAVIHIGDMAYDMYEQNGTTGDLFMNDIQTMAANTPYMVAMGNHESAYNFSHYTQRFRGQPLPLDSLQTVWTQSGELPNNWWYSFNYGIVHFICISSEIYFNFPWLVSIQYEWLINDLKIANTNRTLAPWVIAYHHRPLYCDATGSECEDQAFVMRNGILLNNSNNNNNNNNNNGHGSVEYKYGLEQVYYDYGVDIVFNGHIHAYERTYDIYLNQTQQKTKNMQATTYIIDGDAGNREGHHLFNNYTEAWSAYRTNAYSFSHMKVYNDTHIHFKQIMADSELPPNQQGEVLDEVWLIQENHGPFNQSSISSLSSVGTNEDKKKAKKERKDTITYDPWSKYGIEMKKVEDDHDDGIFVQYISDNKMDYKGIDGVYF